MANPQMLAKALGTPLAAPYQKRSKYLAEALKGIQAPQEIRSGGQLAANLMANALLQFASARNDKKLATAETADKQAAQDQRVQDAQSFFPNDPQAQAAYVADPSGGLGSFWDGRKPQTVSQGSTVVSGGQPVYTAPVMGVSEGRGYVQTPEGFSPQGELAPTQVQQWGQQNAVAGQQLDRDKFGYQQRHDQSVLDPIAFGQLNVNQQNAGANMMGARASQSNAGVNRLEYEARKAQGGFGTPGTAVAPWQMFGGQ